MAQVYTVAVPDLGDFREVEVVDVLVKPGDVVAPETPLVTIESDKATMDVPSTAGGRVVRLRVASGDRVSTGSPVVDLEAEVTNGDAAGDAPGGAPAGAADTRAIEVRAPDAGDFRDGAANEAAVRPGEPVALPGTGPIEETGFARAHAGPSVRRLARELGVDLARVGGSGVKGRVTHDDVKAWVKRTLAGGVTGVTGAAGGAGGTAGAVGLPRLPQVDFAKYGVVELQALSRIQRLAGPRLHASWVNLPHVTQFDEADITTLEETRAQLKQKALDEGIRLTPLAFVVRAVVRVLRQFPRFNASLDAGGEHLVLKKYVHMGFAADTPGGLVVPVIRDAHRKDVYELARELGSLSEKARAGKLSAAELQGGSFTVSSLGGIGGTAFTPIINAPEVAILGVSRSATRPVWQDGQFMPRLMLPLSLSYDHRVIDGADAARFTAALAAALADVRGLLEAVP